MVIHESAEDYLESILILQEQCGQVRSIDIVNKLGYSKPSVSIAMKKLRESGYISMAPDGAITLNESGMEIASRVYSRHKTITRLFELLGVSPEQAAIDACKVEHDLSQETFDRICDFVERTEKRSGKSQCCSGESAYCWVYAVATFYLHGVFGELLVNILFFPLTA